MFNYICFAKCKQSKFMHFEDFPYSFKHLIQINVRAHLETKIFHVLQAEIGIDECENGIVNKLIETFQEFLYVR
jgi:hypothetical protein